MRCPIPVLLIVLVSACVPKSEYLRLQSQLEVAEARLAVEKESGQTLLGERDEARKTALDLQAELEALRKARELAIRDLEDQLRLAREAGSSRAGELESALASAKKARDEDVRRLEEQVAAAQAEAARQAAELARLNEAQENLRKGLEKDIEAGKVVITNLRGRLTVNLIDKILFDSGSAELNDDGKAVLDKVSDVLKDVQGRRISVQGHTDDVPIGKSALGKFPSNWELSTQRASTVVRHLVERGVAPEKLSAAGFAMYAPMAPNDSEENRRLNRRIEIVLLPELKADNQ